MWPNNGNRSIWNFLVCRKMKFRFSDNLNVYKRERECLSRVGENRSCLKLPRNVPPLLLTWLAILLQNQLNFLKKRRKHTLEKCFGRSLPKKKICEILASFCYWQMWMKHFWIWQRYHDDEMSWLREHMSKPSDKDCDMLDCHVINIHPTRNCQF